MSANVSTYLDLLRCGAALAVVLFHARSFLLPELPDLIAGHGGEAVAAFFVLSGFLIGFTVDRQQQDWRGFARARLARIYSVAPLALAVTALADAVGHVANPAAYGGPFFSPASLPALLRALTFTSELWASHSIFGSNEPYWSLSFEVVYYVAFGLICFLPGWAGVVAATAVLTLAGPKIAAFFPLWLLGAATYQVTRSTRLQISRRTAIAGFVATWPAYFALRQTFGSDASAMFVYERTIANACYFTAVGAIVSLNILSFDLMARGVLIWPKQLACAIRWSAGGTFTLYLIHQPLLVAFAALRPHSIISSGFGVAALLATLLISALLAELGERRKAVFSELVPHLLGPRRR